MRREDTVRWRRSVRGPPPCPSQSAGRAEHHRGRRGVRAGPCRIAFDVSAVEVQPDETEREGRLLGLKDHWHNPVSGRTVIGTTDRTIGGMTGCSHGADCALVDGLGRVGLVGRCCLREPVGCVRRLFECCRIILLKPGVWRPASGWAGCLRAVVMDAQTCLSRPAFRRRDAVALLRRPSARSARRVIASGTWPTSKESNGRTIGGSGRPPGIGARTCGVAQGGLAGLSTSTHVLSRLWVRQVP